MNAATQKRWLVKLSKLRVDRKGGSLAPHKPLLLLAIIELAEQGFVPVKVLRLSPELAFRFYAYWTVVAYRRTQEPDIRYPFYHLQNDGFWVALGEDGKPPVERRLARCAELDPDFETCLKDSAFRDEARKVLIFTYFPREEWPGLCALLGIPDLIEGEPPPSLLPHSREQAEQRGREARFRINVVTIYNYTCALTGYRLLTISSGSIIDAAHIHQFADSQNNETRNGIALCKNAHWLFDNGLWTITEDYTVKVALGHFTEEAPDQNALSEYQGKMIRLPSDPTLYPDPDHLAWHRRERFLESD
jgi:putative restriction endonuclease